MKLARRTSPTLSGFPSILDRFFEGDWMDWNHSNFADVNATLPAVNVEEHPDKYEIDVAAPGMKKEDFHLKVENGVLTISAEQKTEKREDDKHNYSRREFSYTSFQRSFSLPDEIIDGEKIEAKYSDGILCISIPKKDEVKPKPVKTIAIS